MTQNRSAAAALTLIALASCHSGPARTQDAGSPQPSAAVELSPLTNGTLTEKLRAYGTIVPAPGAARTVTRPFELKVRRVLVSSGQLVRRGDALIEIEGSPDTQLQLDEAKRARSSAARLLETVRRRLRSGLAVNADLVSAEQAFGDAQARFESFKARGAQGPVRILADSTGRIGVLQVDTGALVPAGGPLMELLADDAMEARLGVEPEDLGRISAGMPVEISPVHRAVPTSVPGRLRVLSGAVAPDTRLVDALVSLPHPEQFLEGEFVTGDILAQARDALIAPRQAVLPEEGRWVLFTVENGRALKHEVKIGLETDKQVELVNSGLSAGQQVVILGAYELTDGMSVRVPSR